MRSLLIFLFALVATTCAGQSVLPFRGDTIKIYKVGGSSELVIQNRTKDTLGFLVNVGGGRTEFRRVKKINDTTLVFGFDTVKVGSGTGGGITSIITKNPITKVGDSVAITIDPNAVAVKGDKITTKHPVLRTYAALRSIATADLDTGFVYKVNIDGEYGEFVYRPTDTSTPEDSAVNIRTSDGKLLQRVITDGWVNAKWFGAKGDGTTDDTYALQRCIDWVLANSSIYKKIYIPRGEYKITNGLVVYKDANADGFPEFVTLEIKGDAFSYGYQSVNASTIINATHVDNFALGIQFGKGVRVEKIGFKGGNDLYSLSIADIYGGNRSTWVKGATRSNSKSTYVAIAIEPFHAATSSGDRYPRMDKYYNNLVNTGTTGSTDVIIDEVFINNFLAGVIFSPNGYSQNAENCRIQNSWIYYVRDAVVNAQSQTRTNQISNLKVWGGVHTVFNSADYGQGNGVMPNVDNVNIAGYNYQLMKLLSGWTGASFRNVYAELLYRLGDWGSAANGLPVAIHDSYFDIPTGQHYTSAKYIGNRLFCSGCTIRMYNNQTGFVTGNGNGSTFLNSMLSGPIIPYRDVMGVVANKIVARDYYKNVNLYGLPVIGTSGKVESDLTEVSDRYGWFNSSVFGVNTARVRPAIFGQSITNNRTVIPLTYEYGLGGESDQFIMGNHDAGRTVVFNGSNGTAYFVTTTPGQYYVGDIIAQQGITATIDGEGGISQSILGVVTSIASDTVKLGSVTDINPTSETKTGVNIYVYQQAEFMEPVIGDITAGSNVITNIRFNNRLRSIKPYTTIYHPTFPHYARITSIDYNAKTITLNKNAATSETNAIIDFRNIIGKGTAIQHPNTINYLSYPSFDSTYGMVAKGSFFTNTGSDTLITGWLCIRTGYLGTTRPPLFTEVRPTTYAADIPIENIPNEGYVSKSQLVKVTEDLQLLFESQPPSGLSEVVHDTTLTGKGTTADSLRVNLAHFYTKPQIDSALAAIAIGEGYMTEVITDPSLTGNGTALNPLKVDTTFTHQWIHYRIDSLIASGGIAPDGSETKVQAGSGVSVSGSGTSSLPYIISVSASLGNQWNMLVVDDFGAVPNVNTSTQRNLNTLAFRAAWASAQSRQLILVPGGGRRYYLDDSVLISSASKYANWLVMGDVEFVTTSGKSKGFIVGDGSYHRFVATGEISGGGTGGGADSASWRNSTYNSTGVYLRNSDKGRFYFQRIIGFHTGLKIGGESTTIPKGSQYNVVEGMQIKWNFIQVHLTTTGTTDGSSPGDKGNWCTSTTLRDFQLGGGTTPGTGGWIGVLVQKMANSNQTTTNPSNYNIFDNLGLEGVYWGFICENMDFSTFQGGGRIEEPAVGYPFYISKDNANGKECYANDFSGMTGIYEKYFYQGANGYGSTFGPTFTNSGTIANYIAGDAGNTYSGIGFNAPTTHLSSWNTAYIDGLNGNDGERYFADVYRNGTRFYVPFATKAVPVTSAYSVASGIGFVVCTGTFTVTLPTASSWPGREITVKNIGSGTITVSPVVSGNTTSIAQHEAATYVAYGTNWYVKDQKPAGGGGGYSNWTVTGSDIYRSSKVGIGVTTPTARLHIGAGSTSANSASLKINPGSLLTSPENGAIENDGDDLYYTDDSNTRHKLIHGGNISQYINDGDWFATTTVSGVSVSGAGSGATVSISAPNNKPRAIDFRILGGSGGGTNTDIATLTFSNTIPSDALIQITPANSLAAARPVYANITSSTTISVKIGGTALQSGSSHIYNITIVTP